MNNLPKYWFVKNDKSKEFQKVVDYLDTICSSRNWHCYDYVGYDGSAFCNGCHGFGNIGDANNSAKLISISEFIKLKSTKLPKTLTKSDLIELIDLTKNYPLIKSSELLKDFLITIKN